MGQIKDINQAAIENENFRQVIETGEHTQVVVMSIPPDGEIGEEIHEDNDQLLLLIEGEGRLLLGDEETEFDVGDAVLVPAGINHNVMNAGADSLKIITTYSPPHHEQGTIHATKKEADAAEAAEGH